MSAGSGAGVAEHGPRVLVTGFSAFPGAPVNPTEALIDMLSAAPPPAGAAAFRAVVLPVEYATVAARLAQAADGLDPDIAIHFGLAAGARGFRLERIARNSLAEARPDNAGCLPMGRTICDGADALASTLPLAPIATALEAEGLPFEWSDDAGGYLCNVVFMLSRAHACEGLSAEMSGFIHVADAGHSGLPADALLRGATIIIETCIREWISARRHPA